MNTTVATTVTGTTIPYPILGPVYVHKPVDYFIICVVPLLVVTLIGNFILMFVMLRNKVLRTKGHVFVITLSISSIVLLLFAIPSTLYMFLCKCGLPPVWCNTVGHTNSMALLLTMLNMPAIAVYRFLKVAFPMKPKLSGRKTVVGLEVLAVTLGIVLPSIALSLNWTSISYIPLFHRCTIDGAKSKAVYGIFTFSLMVLCFITSLFCYTSIYTVLRRSRSKIGSVRVRPSEAPITDFAAAAPPATLNVTNLVIQHDGSSNTSTSTASDVKTQSQRKERKRELKLFKICLIKFGVYILAYVPYTILNLSGTVSTDLHQTFTIITWFGVCWSPLVYGLLHGAVSQRILALPCFSLILRLCNRRGGDVGMLDNLNSNNLQPSRS